MTRGPQVSYQQLQEIRQTRIRDAVLDPETPVQRLVSLFQVAHRGLIQANVYGATDSDAITFLRLEEDIRDRLRMAPRHEVVDALAQLALPPGSSPVE